MTSATRRGRRSIGTLLACLLSATVAIAGVGLATEAGSVAGVDFTRLSGADRYATAAAVATDTFGTSSIALLVSGENFADAIASSYLAGVSDSPILLSRRDDVPASTLAALQSLSVDFVVLVGGTQALSTSVATQLTNSGFPNARVAGADRYETAKNISFVTGTPTVGLNENGKRTAILASGQAFPDALAAGPLAYDDGFPILLTEAGGLHPQAEQALVTLGITHVLIAGGTGAIGSAIEQRLGQLGLTSERLAGADRYATARAIADKAITALGHTASHVDIATGERFPDALSGGPHAGSRQGVILLTPMASTAALTCGFLADRAATVTSGHLLGGELALTSGVETALEACAGGTTPTTPPGGTDPNIDFPASPATDRLAAAATDGSGLTWTFSGVTSIVDVALVPCFAINRGAATVFADDQVPLDGAFPPDSNDSAVRRAPDYLGQSYRSFRIGTPGAAQITNANGAITPTAYVDGLAAPAGGTLSVTVGAASPDCAVPVVFADPADDDTVQLDASDRPTDAFGAGGAGVFTAGEAPDQTLIAGEVMYADEAADFVVLANGFQYDYGDAGDTYRYIGFSIPVADFEAGLSPLDSLGVAGAPSPYSRTTANRFDIGVDTAGRVTGVAAVVGDFDDVPADDAANDARVTFAAPAPVDGLVIDYVVDAYRCAPTCLLVRQALDSDHEPASAPVPPNQDVNGDGIDDDVDRQVVVEDLQAGTYRFVAHAVTFSGHRSLFGSDPSPQVGAAAVAGAPRSTSAVYTEGPSFNGTVDPGDVLRVTFDETMAAPQAVPFADLVTIRDPQGDTVNLVHGSNATFAVVGNVLSITINSVVADGLLTFVGLQATGSSGITDLGGLEWDLPGSGDRTFG